MTKTGFETLRVYILAEAIADKIWEIVEKWDRLPKDTVGKQMIRAADSIGANIAEGTGRGSYADNKRFAKIARGSLFEVKHWLRRSYKRCLLTQDEIDSLKDQMEGLAPKLSSYINSIGNSPKFPYKEQSLRKNKPLASTKAHFPTTPIAAKRNGKGAWQPNVTPPPQDPSKSEDLSYLPVQGDKYFHIEATAHCQTENTDATDDGQQTTDP